MKIKMRLALLVAAILPIALSAATYCNPPSVPDGTNTLMLLGAGLGVLVAAKKKFFSQTQ